ncbi:hypothetical protein CYMTET_55245 [Cymbomonas tetramitiformis]|uniref:Uncharacterized protein n=1 Tax=Cymbomonas tetramitiformis TaxID=36881 RepID=A0AAE0ENS8_9CHLO|nr:hypothetical protein CYMTET_55245 [Cymbomonas tetramitiformis]
MLCVTLYYLRRARLLRARPGSARHGITVSTLEPRGNRGPTGPGPLPWCIFDATKSLQCSFIEYWQAQGFALEDESGRTFFGRATHFVSHAWHTEYSQTVDASTGALEPAEDAAYLYLDIFVINQHCPPWHTPGVGPEEVLGRAITAARAVLLVLTPWSAPVALTRVWCLYEITTTIHLSTPLQRCKVQAQVLGERRNEVGVNEDGGIMQGSKVKSGVEAGEDVAQEMEPPLVNLDSDYLELAGVDSVPMWDA